METSQVEFENTCRKSLMAAICLVLHNKEIVGTERRTNLVAEIRNGGRIRRECVSNGQ